jgi:hypothetical protein
VESTLRFWISADEVRNELATGGRYSSLAFPDADSCRISPDDPTSNYRIPGALLAGAMLGSPTVLLVDKPFLTVWTVVPFDDLAALVQGDGVAFAREQRLLNESACAQGRGGEKNAGNPSARRTARPPLRPSGLGFVATPKHTGLLAKRI